MQIGSIIAIYFLFFSASAFVLLPFGVKTDEEVGAEKVPGQADSAPACNAIPPSALSGWRPEWRRISTTSTTLIKSPTQFAE